MPLLLVQGCFQTDPRRTTFRVRVRVRVRVMVRVRVRVRARVGLRRDKRCDELATLTMKRQEKRRVDKTQDEVSSQRPKQGRFTPGYKADNTRQRKTIHKATPDNT